MHSAAGRRTALTIVAAMICVSPMSACAPISSSGYEVPPAAGALSYQLGGSYAPPAGTDIVVRDRTESPASGAVFNVCYVNVLQTQPDGAVPDPGSYGTTAWWVANHPSLLLRDGAGDLVIDEDWDEALFDVSTAAKRQELFDIQRKWIEQCAEDGFDAIEPDNIDSNERSHGLLTHADIRAYLALVVTHAHDAGLAIGQKNAIDAETGFGDEGAVFVNGTEGFDFAIVEECGAFDECADYAAIYPERVYDIEYDRESFASACEHYGAEISIQLRDLDLTTPGDASYVEEWCER